MTCEECLHYKFCANEHGDTDYYDDEVVDGAVETVCNKLEDKSMYIKLPCKVGDAVFIIEKYPDGTASYEECTVTFFRFNGKSVYFGVDIGDFALCKESDIGKTIFLSKADIERKLREMNDGS